jgi:hypothetical protein
MQKLSLKKTSNSIVGARVPARANCGNAEFDASALMSGEFLATANEKSDGG